MRLTFEQFNEIRNTWYALPSKDGNGPDDLRDFYDLVAKADAALIPSDRFEPAEDDYDPKREELLKLAEELAVAWTGNPGYEIQPDAQNFDAYAKAFVNRAAAIIAEVDRVSGGKPKTEGLVWVLVQALKEAMMYINDPDPVSIQSHTRNIVSVALAEAAKHGVTP